jgi:aryl-alcohol dehydrogenase-like predicted oxidoreductase
MQFRNLGASGLRVSELCLGTMTFGSGFQGIGVVDQAGADAIVRRALDAGVNFFDTADVYSRGQSEEILGRALRASGVPRHSVVVATKVRGTMSDAANAGTGDVNNRGLGRKHVLESIDGSLARLGMDYVDLYQIHGVDPMTPIEETLEALNDVVRMGKALFIGVSNLAAWQIEKALGISERRAWARFVSVQAYYSLVARDLEVEVLPMAREEGLGVLTWSPLAGGYVSGKYRAGAPKVGRRNHFDFPQVSPRAEEALAALEEVARARGVSMARVALAWLRLRPGVTSVIVGVRDLDQLEDDLGAAELELTPDELARLGAATMPDLPYPQWMIARQTAARPDAVRRAA